MRSLCDQNAPRRSIEAFDNAENITVTTVDSVLQHDAADREIVADAERHDWDDIVKPPGDRPGYAYFPFGGGPRHCIGMGFARMELKPALATIVCRCRVTHDVEAVEADIGSTVSPAQSVPVRFEQRE